MAHKPNRFIMLAVFFLLQSAFIILIAKEYFDLSSTVAFISIIFFSILLAIGYQHIDLHDEKHVYEDISVLIWVPFGAVVCYLLTIHGELSGVLSAGIVGTLASFIPSINPKSNYLQQIPAPIYCGSFIGMSSITIAPSIYFVITAGLVSGLIFMLSKSLFIGVGGKLGTVAFAGVVVASLLLIFLK
jgi:hypothetical protein